MEKGKDMIKLREATKADRDGILKIASSTWEGWDYVPLFLDEWLQEGGLYVAEMEGEIVGMTKTTELSPGELWLEAIRVSEERREHGLGRWIAEEQLRRALDTHPRSIRLSTADINTASLKIIHHLGFREYVVFHYCTLSGVSSYDETVNLSPVRRLSSRDEAEIRKAWKLITSSDEYKASRGLLAHTWKFTEWTEGLFRVLIDKGYVHATSEIKGVLLLLPNRYTPSSLEIAFIDGDEESVDILGNFALREIDFRQTKDVRSAGFVASDRKREIFARLGIQPRDDLKKVYVFDYPINAP